MKIINITSRSRRDFNAERISIYFRYMICQYCKNTSKLTSGYDNDYYHTNVIPKMKCIKCGKSTLSEKDTPDVIKTKYTANQIV